MSRTITNWLHPPGDESRDHILGPAGAEITLVEYGSYACPDCRSANDSIAQARSKLGNRVRYVFRHYPTGGALGRRAAELVEHSTSSKAFWNAHGALMTRSDRLTEEDLDAVADTLALTSGDESSARDTALRARARVDADVESAEASGVVITPTFFINDRRYDGPWDITSFAEALVGTLGHRLRTAALDFTDWA